MALVKTDSSFTNIIQQLIDKEQGGPFNTYMDLFCACAALGIKDNIKREVTTAGIEVQDRVWKNNHTLEKKIFLTALYDQKKAEILKDEDECYKIFETYVNGGLTVLEEIFSRHLDTEGAVDELMAKAAHMALENTSD